MLYNIFLKHIFSKKTIKYVYYSIKTHFYKYLVMDYKHNFKTF